MSRPIHNAVTYFAYLCVGTCLAELLLVAWFWSDGTLSQEKWVRILAVVHEVDLPDPQAERQAATRLVNLDYEDLEQLRGVKTLDLELKHQALEHQHRELLKQSKRVAAAQRTQEALEAQLRGALAQIRGELETTGHRGEQLWTQLSSEQIKDHLVRLSAAGELDSVLLSLANMPLVKQARILKAFVTPEEQEVLHSILEKLRSRQPHRELLESLEQKLPQEPAAAN